MVQLLRDCSAEMNEVKTSVWRQFVLVSGNFFFRFRNALFPVTFAVLFLLTRPALFLGNQTLDSIIVMLGILVALAGQVFRLLVIGYAYIKRGGKEGKVYADDLVVRGFYAHTRNPMYVGNFLITVGLSLVYGSPWVYFFVIPFFSFVYLSIVMAEETYLRGKFGREYEEYERRADRFWPNFRGIGDSLKEFQYDWRRALRKDYGTVFGLMFGILFIKAWKAYFIFGFAEKKSELFVFGLLLIPAIVFYSVIRYLKLSGKLVSPSGD